MTATNSTLAGPFRWLWLWPVRGPAWVCRTAAHTVATLQAQAASLRDIDDIKRLQRAYGYYLDVGNGTRSRICFRAAPRWKSAWMGVPGPGAHPPVLLAVGGGHVGLAPDRSIKTCS